MEYLSIHYVFNVLGISISIENIFDYKVQTLGLYKIIIQSTSENGFIYTMPYDISESGIQANEFIKKISNVVIEIKTKIWQTKK